MSERNYTNSGILFKNFRKRPGTKDPDHQGSAKVVCLHCHKVNELKLSAWSKPGKKGEFLSVAFKEDRPEAPAGLAPAQPEENQTDEQQPKSDDIPF